MLLLFVARPHLCGADPLTDAVHRGDAARIQTLLAGQPDLRARDAADTGPWTGVTYDGTNGTNSNGDIYKFSGGAPFPCFVSRRPTN